MTDEQKEFIKKNTLKEVAESLRMFDFSNFDPIKDKNELLRFLTTINSKLGGLLARSV